MKQRLAPARQRPDRTRAMVLLASSLGGFLITFVSSSVNIALPLIQEEFGASAVMLSWVPLSFLLVGTAVMLPAGRIADRYGRMRLFISGSIIFTVMSFASAFAPSIGSLIALRAAHGLGLAIGGTTSTALVVLAYPPESRGRAMGLNVGAIYLGLALGPVMGGLITHNLGWRALFLAVGALGAVDVVLPLWKLRHVDWRETERTRLDIVGSLVWGTSLAGVLLGFSLLPELGGATLVPAGIVGLGLFLWWEKRAPCPLLDIDLIRNSRVFALSSGATLIGYSAASAMAFLMSLYLQYNRGLSPQTAGMVLVTGVFIQATLSPAVGRLADRVEARYVASAGLVVSMLGLFGLAFLGAATPYWYVIAMICVVNLGVSLFATPNMYIVMGSVETRWAGVASAAYSTMRQTGISLSQGFATMVLALEVGRQAISPADYPGVLRSVRVTFVICAALCILGIAASMAGPGRARHCSRDEEHGDAHKGAGPTAG